MRGVNLGQVRQEYRPMREIDYLALRMLTSRSLDATPLKLSMALKRIDKAWKRGQLGYPVHEPTDWKWRMCEARMMMGDYSDWSGWEYRSEWSAGMWHNTGDRRLLADGTVVKQIPAWQGQEVPELLVYGEQGIGDEVLLIQALGAIRDRVGVIHLNTQARLMSLFDRCLGVKSFPVEHDVREEDGEPIRRIPEAFCPWIPLGDIARNHFNKFEDFPRKPYLSALPEQVERFKAYRGRVGISWRGAQGSYPLEEFKRRFPDAVSLQYDMGWDEDCEAPEGLDLRNDLEGLCGLLMNLERLVTVSTSVAHFAGALGVKTDVILAPLNGIRKNLLPFKWGLKEKTPWYGDHVTVWQSLPEFARIQLR